MKNEITALCKDMFEDLWTKEVSRIEGIFNKYQTAKDNFVPSEAPEGTPHSQRSRFKTFSIDTWALNYYGCNSWNDPKKALYDKIKSLIAFICQVSSKGMEAYLERHRKGWFEALTAKLDGEMDKYLQDTDKFITGVVKGSPKGYVVQAEFTRDNIRHTFTTQAIPAGGYNIQCFHYRYKGNVK